MFSESNIHKSSKKGWIEVICGSMFSGKTEELIRRLKRAQFAKQKVEIFKPKTDTRYHEEHVVSHSGNVIQSTVVSSSTSILLLANDAEVIGIDEAQFFDMELVAVVKQLADSGVRVIIAGLDIDFTGQPFGPMPYLLACAEQVTKVQAICLNCGNLAYISHRLTEETHIVLLGASTNYEPLCRSCFNAKNSH